MKERRTCPNPECGVDLRASEIPEASRHMYGNSTHFMRTVGFYAFDMTLFYFCPDCNGAWHRFPAGNGKHRFRAAGQMDINNFTDYTPSTNTEVSDAASVRTHGE